MYVPNHFKENDTQKLQQYIREYGFGVLIVADEKGIEANHLPVYLQCAEEQSLGLLQCHVARNNPVWKRLIHSANVLAVFQGPDAYISPSWYSSKAESGRVVPTWNYLAVHAEGSARIIEDKTWLRQHLQLLTNQHESKMAEPWKVDDAPSDFTDGLLNAIVGIEITIETLTGKLKASQNQPQQNRAGVKAGLEKEGGAKNGAMSKFIN